MPYVCLFYIHIVLHSFYPQSSDEIILDFYILVQLRRERIAERIRALQELVPSVNKVNGLPHLFQITSNKMDLSFILQIMFGARLTYMFMREITPIPCSPKF